MHAEPVVRTLLIYDSTEGNDAWDVLGLFSFIFLHTHVYTGYLPRTRFYMLLENVENSICASVHFEAKASCT